jgi:hypothetical protein
VGPSKRGDVREEIGGAIQPDPLPRGHGLTEVLGVPVDDDGGEQVQPGHSEVLALGCSITDFTLAANAQGVFQRMMRFALIQADLGTALHVGIQQPIDDEQRPFDPADFAQCDRKFMLSGVGCKFPQ